MLKVIAIIILSALTLGSFGVIGYCTYRIGKICENSRR